MFEFELQIPDNDNLSKNTPKTEKEDNEAQTFSNDPIAYDLSNQTNLKSHKLSLKTNMKIKEGSKMVKTLKSNRKDILFQLHYLKMSLSAIFIYKNGLQ